jgi:hypothetical protein
METPEDAMKHAAMQEVKPAMARAGPLARLGNLTRAASLTLRGGVRSRPVTAGRPKASGRKQIKNDSAGGLQGPAYALDNEEVFSVGPTKPHPATYMAGSYKGQPL